MTLADLRKLSIRKQLKIRFRLANGMECVVTEHGVAQVAELRRVPDFNLEQELAAVSQFTLEPAKVAAKTAAKVDSVTREQLSALLAIGPGAAAPEHEED